MVTIEDIKQNVEKDIKYIKDKYGEQEELTSDQWFTLLAEEVGELAKSINDGEVANMLEEGSQCISCIYCMLEAVLKKEPVIINKNLIEPENKFQAAGNIEEYKLHDAVPSDVIYYKGYIFKCNENISATPLSDKCKELHKLRNGMYCIFVREPQLHCDLYGVVQNLHSKYKISGDWFTVGYILYPNGRTEFKTEYSGYEHDLDEIRKKLLGVNI